MQTPIQTRFWINIVSLDHAQKGVAKGMTQGGEEALKALSEGDFVLFYSPRTRFRQGKPHQQFTALGLIEDGKPKQASESDGRIWQRQTGFLATKPVKLEPLAGDLTFITDKEQWAIPFSKGLFEITQADFQLIAQAMGVAEAEL
jgi:hypothetical protein